MSDDITAIERCWDEIERLRAELVQLRTDLRVEIAGHERTKSLLHTLKDGIAEHKWAVSPYLYPDEIVHEHDCRLWALIGDGDDE